MSIDREAIKNRLRPGSDEPDDGYISDTDLFGVIDDLVDEIEAVADGTKLGPDSVSQGNLAPNSVGASEIQSKAVAADEIDDEAIIARHLADGALPVAKVSGLAAVATSGAYSDLSGGPTLGTAAAAATSDFATAAQGALAATAVQPSRTISAGTGLTGGGSLATNRAFAVDFTAVATSAQGAKADTAVQPSLIDAKGDLLVGTANDTVARLPVSGTNGHVLTVDSAEAAGVRWAAPSAAATRWALRLPGTSPSGNHVSTPAATLTYTGLTELDVRWVGSLTAVGPATQTNSLFYQWGAATSWLLSIDSGESQVRLRLNGATATTWTHGANITANTIVGIRFVWRADAGSGSPDLRIFTSADEGATWTLRQTVTASIPSSLTANTSDSIFVGALSGLVLTASIRRNGTLVAEYDARDGVTPRYYDPNSGQIWTVNGTANSAQKGI